MVIDMHAVTWVCQYSNAREGGTLGFCGINNMDVAWHGGVSHSFQAAQNPMSKSVKEAPTRFSHPALLPVLDTDSHNSQAPILEFMKLELSIIEWWQEVMDMTLFICHIFSKISIPSREGRRGCLPGIKPQTRSLSFPRDGGSLSFN